MAESYSYDKIVEKLMEEAGNDVMGYASDMVVDGDYVVIINVVKLGHQGIEDEEYEA